MHLMRYLIEYEKYKVNQDEEIIVDSSWSTHEA
jgi:hypothetical protein